jgi:hypothetical protein
MSAPAVFASRAAVQVGVSKPSITRAIKAGKINADKNEFGDWRIRRSESRALSPSS